MVVRMSARIRFRHAVKLSAQKAGYVVSRIVPYDPAPGRDAGHDLKGLLAQTPSPLILDVGANTGQSVKYFRDLVPDCRIHCFEPSPTAYRELETGIARLPDVCANPVAVGSAAGTLTLRENDHTDMSSMLSLGNQGWGKITRELEVPVVTIDGYCADAGIDRANVLKVDTQGYELEVLKGAAGLLSSGKIDLVYAEVIFAPLYDDLPAFDELYRFLVDREMRLVALYNYAMRDSAAVAWCDALFASTSFLSRTGT